MNDAQEFWAFILTSGWLALIIACIITQILETRRNKKK